MMSIRYRSSSGPKVIKLFLFSTLLNMKLLINSKIARINGIIKVKSSNPVLYRAHKCWHLSIYEQEIFYAHLS